MIKPRKHADFRYLTSLPFWLTLTRSSAAWAVQNGVLVEYATDEARLISGKGLLREEERENLILYSRDCSDVSWAENDNVTTSTILGLDGIDNSAIEATATGNNAIVGQTVTEPMNCYSVSVYLKVPDANTGKIYFSIDGITYQECADVNSQSFTRYTITSIVENPGVFIKIENDNDIVIVDCAQIEIGQFSTSPIVTTTVPVTRAADIIINLLFSFSAGSGNWFGADQGTFFIGFEPYRNIRECTLLSIQYYPDYDQDYFAIKVLSELEQSFDVGYNQSYLYQLNEGASYPTRYHVATSYAANNQLASINGSTPLVSGQVQAIDFSTTNRWWIGSLNETGDEPFNGFITSLSYYNQTLSQTELNDITVINTPILEYDYNNILVEELAIRVVADGGTIESPSCIDLTDLEMTASLVITPNAVKAGKIYAILPVDGSGDLTFDRNSDATRRKTYGATVADDSYESVITDIPRRDYEDSCPSLLFEPQRTNNRLHSADMSQTSVWLDVALDGAAAPVRTAAYAPSPIDGIDAVRVQLDRSAGGASAFSGINQAYIAATGNDYYVSVWLKSLSGTPTVCISTGNAQYHTVTLTSQWVRYSVALPNYSHATSFAGVGLMAIAPSTSLTCDILVGNFQIEDGEYDTSDIITGAATVTRISDSPSKLSVSSLIGQTEGSILIDFVYSSSDVAYLMHLVDVSLTQQIEIYLVGNVLYFAGFDGSSQWSINTSALSVGTRYKIAAGYKTDDIVLYVNGTQIGTDNSASVPECTDIYINQNASGIYRTKQRYNKISLLTTRETNPVLQSWSTI